MTCESLDIEGMSLEELNEAMEFHSSQFHSLSGGNPEEAELHRERVEKIGAQRLGLIWRLPRSRYSGTNVG